MSSTSLPDAAVAAVAQLAEKATTTPRHQMLGSAMPQRPALIWPDKQIQDIEHLLAAPVCKRGVATLGDHVAFADYVNAHRTAGLVIFGEVNETSGFFTAILDGHVPAKLKPREGDTAEPIAIESPGAPGWGDHVAKLPLIATPEWARWIGKSGKVLSQSEFAEFLEENAADVIVPDTSVTHVAGFPVPHGNLPTSAQLMSVALTLQAKTDVTFSSKINRQNGQVQVTFNEAISATSNAEGIIGIPEYFAIAVAPFRGGSAQIVLARLRYRAERGAAKFEFQIIRPHKIVEHAWNLVRKDIAGAIGESVLLGSVSIPGRKY
jgi:uncharacterized protein YfdQ (DUF2303 family)